MTKVWRQKKRNGRFFALDDQLPKFKAAVDAKQGPVAEVALLEWHGVVTPPTVSSRQPPLYRRQAIIHEAQAFVDTLRGQVRPTTSCRQ